MPKKKIEYLPTGIKVFDTEFYILEGEDLGRVREGMDLVYQKAKAFDAVQMDELVIDVE